MSAAAILLDEHSIHLCPDWCITRIHIIRAKRVSNSHLRYTAILRIGLHPKKKTVTVVVITGGGCVAKKKKHKEDTTSHGEKKRGEKKRKKKEVPSIALANFDWIV